MHPLYPPLCPRLVKTLHSYAIKEIKGILRIENNTLTNRYCIESFVTEKPIYNEQQLKFSAFIIMYSPSLSRTVFLCRSM